MYFKEGDSQEMEVSPAFKGILVVMAAIVVLLGIFPQWLLDKLYYFL
jgi:NADH-quinone oxidoreductase subunit N